jgi:hypothetical protein
LPRYRFRQLWAVRAGESALVTLFLCAVAVSGGIILIEELDNPLSGFIHGPPDSMRKALVEITH